MKLVNFLFAIETSISGGAGALAWHASSPQTAIALSLISAVAFGLLGFTWAKFAPRQPRSVRLSAMGSTPTIALVAFFWVCGQIQAEQSAPQKVTSGPVLSAHNNSIINADGAEFPSNLPFKIAEANKGSVISMQNLKVKQNDNGSYTLTSGDANLQFPSPPDELLRKSTPDLKKLTRQQSSRLRAFQAEFDAAFFEPGRKYPDSSKAQRIHDEFESEYEREYAADSYNLAAALLNRIGTVNNLSDRNTRFGGLTVYYRRLWGLDGAANASAFLEMLLSNVPDDAQAN